MIVRSVKIDKKFADAFEDLKGDGRAVDELLVGTAEADGALDEEFPILAGLQAGFGEDGIDGGGVLQGKGGLDGAGVFAIADEGAVGALAQDELQGTDDDGLASSCFSRHANESWPQFPGDVFDEGKVADFDKREHGAMKVWRV